VLSRRGFTLFVLSLAGSGAFAQVVGTVERVSGNVIYVATGAKPIALYTDVHTEIWKGKVFHDLSQVVVGDHITARYRTDASGRFIADALWLDITNLYAVTTKVTGSGFEVLTNPNADPQSAYRKENKSIEVDADTVFESCAREDLKQGRDVQVVGLVLGNGDIRATRVTVYEGGRPVRMGRNVVITSPDGSRHLNK
jgi:hypothetical protein